MLKHRLRRIKRNFKPKTTTPLKQQRLTTKIEHKSTKIINLVGYVREQVTFVRTKILLS